MVACYLAECGCQLMNPTTLEMWDERYVLAVGSVGGNVRTCCKLRLEPTTHKYCAPAIKRSIVRISLASQTAFHTKEVTMYNILCTSLLHGT